MNWIKLILIAIGLFVVASLAFSIVGIIYSAVFYLFLLGVVAVGGTVAYKLLIKKSEPAKLEEKTPIGIADLNNADRALEEYKRRYLSE